MKSRTGSLRTIQQEQDLLITGRRFWEDWIQDTTPLIKNITKFLMTETYVIMEKKNQGLEWLRSQDLA